MRQTQKLVALQRLEVSSVEVTRTRMSPSPRRGRTRQRVLSSWRGLVLIGGTLVSAVPLDRIAMSHRGIVMALHGLIEHIELVSCLHCMFGPSHSECSPFLAARAHAATRLHGTLSVW